MADTNSWSEFRDWILPLAAQIRAFAASREQFLLLFKRNYPFVRISNEESFLRAYYDRFEERIRNE